MLGLTKIQRGQQKKISRKSPFMVWQYLYHTIILIIYPFLYSGSAFVTSKPILMQMYPSWPPLYTVQYCTCILHTMPTKEIQTDVLIFSSQLLNLLMFTWESPIWWWRPMRVNFAFEVLLALAYLNGTMILLNILCHIWTFTVLYAFGQVLEIRFPESPSEQILLSYSTQKFGAEYCVRSD